MQCLILAGGLGTRMRLVAGTLPKAILPVGGEPFAHHQLRWLARQGVQRVVYSIGYGGDQIRAAVGDGSPFGLRIDWCDEGSDLRGTGGAVRLACDRGLMEPRFLLLYGDSWLPIEIGPVWAHAVALDRNVMTVIRNEGRWDRSNAIFADGMVSRYDKRTPSPDAAGMRYIDYGLSVFLRKTVMELIPRDQPCDLADMLTKLSEAGDLCGFEVFQRFYEIGSPEGLEEVRALISGI
ncbi:MAG: nucleotidyl transferase [Hyphomicrobiales bacterium]|nr:MAG: nucleotidyl transferase [Hyphomicrobiales bacterium]